MPRYLQQFLFAPLCWACGKHLSRGQDFCFSCRRGIFSALETHGTLLRYEGPVRGLLSCLRSSAPRLAVDWCLGLLRRSGRLEEWKGAGFRAIALAPQNARRDLKGLELLGLALGRELKLPIWRPFTKVGGHRQHGRTLSERMDSGCFVRLRESAVAGKILLLDDVDATGTTLDQCAYLLRKAGAEEVVQFSVARQMVPSLERKNEEPREEGEEVEPFLLHLFV